jgi:hypothetical protein
LFLEGGEDDEHVAMATGATWTIIYCMWKRIIFQKSTSHVTTSNPDSLSSSETGVNPGIRN